MNLLSAADNVFCKHSYLVDKELLDDSELCLICMEMLVDPLECQRCRGVYCTPCTTNWKKINNRCPKKCSTGEWTLKKIPAKNYMMRCPYSPYCAAFSSTQWERHLVYCPFAPERIRKRLELISSNRCDNGHALSSCRHVHAKCSDCNEMVTCLSECEECSLKYCKKCRLPKLTKVICSNGHKFQGISDAFSCDKCFRHFHDQPGYKDDECGLSLCKDCMKELPRREDEQEILRSLKWKRRSSAGNIF